MKKVVFLLTALFFCAFISNAQEVISLYENITDSEQEEINYNSSGDISMISNVVDPSITIYLPNPEIATGTAVVLCPGGAMRFLSWENDVIKMSKFLNEKGIAAIGLKYRLQETSSQPVMNMNPQNAFGASFNLTVTEFDKLQNANANPSTTEESVEAVYRAAADAQEAIRIIRDHASEWNIVPDKIGYLGFSAGGGVATAAVISNTDEKSMPNFIATAYGPSLIDVTVPEDAPPLFICTNADHPNVAAGCLALFMKWKAVGIPTELHIYGDGQMGFNLDKRNQASDTWSDSFITWLTVTGF